VHLGEEQGRTIEVVSTDEIDRGGCRVETEMGTVDATIPTQLQELRRQLVDGESPQLKAAHGNPQSVSPAKPKSDNG
jgi:flagellar biosynthesis/type III secretory pathway protein FliH